MTSLLQNYIVNSIFSENPEVHSLLLGIVVLYLVTTCEGIGPKCYQCDHVADPKDCDHYEQCSDGESCYVQRFMGQQLNDFYKMGCMPNNVCSLQAFSLFGDIVGRRSTERTAHTQAIERARSKREEDLLLCLQCCTHDYCNLHDELCGTVASTNRRCFECNDVNDPTHCEHITECQPHYSCLLHVVFNANANAARYDMGCQKDFVCDKIQEVVNTSTDHVSCLQCCNDRHYCNFDLCPGIKAQLHGYTGNGGPLTVKIPGTHKDQAYNSQVILQCQTSVAAKKRWIFNSSTILPNGVNIDVSTNSLVIDHVTEKTIGSYTCIAAVSGKTNSIKTATTTVSIKPQVPVITSFTTSSNSPQANSEVNLTCIAKGWPLPLQFEWDLRNQKLSNPPPGVSYMSTDHGQIFHIDHFDSKYDRATFSCIASNSVGRSQPETVQLN